MSASIIEVRKTYKYRLYRSKRDKRLHHQMNVAGMIWNHITALQQRYYRLFGNHIGKSRMQKHIAKLRMRIPRFAYWRDLGSQAVQEVCECHEKTYQRFFAGQGGLPRFRKVKKYRSFTLKQAGSKKIKGSRNRAAGKHHVARRQIRIADKRRDWQYQLAHDLCDHYDVMVFEDLNIAAMKRLWGRKVSDLGFAQFMNILKWVAWKRGKRIVQIDRWERTTGICSECGHRQNLELSEREFKCACCGLMLDRDHNAARNIVAAGHRRLLSQSEEDRTSNPRSASGVNVRSPRL
jgi:transposase